MPSNFEQGPARREAYDHVRFLTRSRLAWEYLRRNAEYCRDWRVSAAGRPRPIALTTRTTLIRLRRRLPRAEAWGLCSFRRSVA